MISLYLMKKSIYCIVHVDFFICQILVGRTVNNLKNKRLVLYPVLGSQQLLQSVWHMVGDRNFIVLPLKNRALVVKSILNDALHKFGAGIRNIFSFRRYLFISLPSTIYWCPQQIPGRGLVNEHLLVLLYVLKDQYNLSKISFKAIVSRLSLFLVDVEDKASVTFRTLF